MSSLPSRRQFLHGAAAAAALASASQVTARANTSPATSARPVPGEERDRQLKEPFDGTHQAGIATPAQHHLVLLGFDLKPEVQAEDLPRLMRVWTQDARSLTQGENPPGSLEPEMAENPAGLTVTCGFGPGFFAVAGKEHLAPGWLKEGLPHFSRDQLDPAYGQTDIVLQVCSNNPTTAAFVARHVVRSATTYVSPKWTQRGFLTPDAKSSTPRNLFGQLDGTVNPRTPEKFDEQVWIDKGPEWMTGGSAMVMRRIAMNLDSWETLDRNSREVALGRKLSDGAPLSGGQEFDDVDVRAVDKYGLPKVDRNSHAALARPAEGHPEQRLLRRAYNFDQGINDSGLVFVCYQKDPLAQFAAIQKRLDASDAMNTWVTHVGSAVYFVPPGTSKDAGDTYWGQRLLEA
ncbi:Dyp-type peroxidase [Corynebacterium tapiri]|uniref:Dyp-type peroxidase n=1 Tax=Corynebacterium tapiri TaxID=1448266 RepID=A0A5C4U3Z0_9CORY|nr:Dyp-type peroxidase [Corynebacterium tapiri]TNL97735.1 Dyp-type peroxidase [Corynebacterium tapiri]